MTDERRRTTSRRSDDITLGEVWRLLGEIKDDLRKLLDAAILHRLDDLEEWREGHTKSHQEVRSFWAREGAKWLAALIGAVLGALVISYLQGR